MKIISGWKDYYDHVAYEYSGGDPKVIYERDYAIPDQVCSGTGLKFEETKSIGIHQGPAVPDTMTIRQAGIAEVQRHEFRALVVMDRVFIIERYGDIGDLGGIIRVNKDWHITSRPILNPAMGGLYPLMRDGEAFTDDWSEYQRRRMRETLVNPSNDRLLIQQGEKSDKARKLCEFVGAPVFVVDGRRHPCVMGRTPKLSSLGLPAFIAPEQLYQELAMFVGNVLKPVEQPPSNMTDKEKVVSHGFDKKVSFRHRK